MFDKIVIFVILSFPATFSSELNSKWSYQCTEGYCQKTLITTNVSNPLSLAECNFLCLDYAAVWPRPSGNIVAKNLTEIDVSKISIGTTENANALLKNAFQLFISQIRTLMPCRAFLKEKSSNLPQIFVNFKISDQNTDQLTFGTNESYTIESTVRQNALNLSVEADNFFGARHALETLSQLIIYDDLRNRTLFPQEISITDGPVYQWRGLFLDTARNYITPKAIKRSIQGMAASKMNTLHLHLTDTSSFPYVSKSHPELSQYGAYSPQKIYTNDSIMDIIEYARQRGIRVVPEIDSPAHVGEGWQESGVLTCFGLQPWTTYCAEPPCGQFDPSKAELYDILEDLYGDLLAQFGTNVFHMGGDEVNTNCWNSTENLKDWMVNEKGWGLNTSDFIENVWGYFQSEASQRLYNKAGKEIPIILWNSDLTALDNVDEILSPSKYIIQIWSEGTDPIIESLLDKNYSIILSNYEASYLDCGFSSWVSTGNNWCSPFKGWQAIYDNKPSNITDKTSQILGGEVGLWTEQAGTTSLDSRVWPRAAALAETLWADPSTDWAAAQERMLIHRNRLVELGIDADALQPEWCLQHQQNCPVDGKFVIN